jgi:hypothetical protein
MRIQNTSAKILSLVLAAVVCITPDLWAQQSTQQAPPAPAQQPSNPQSAPANPQLPREETQQQPQSNSTTVNPSQGPLQPVTSYPDASGSQQQEQPAQENGSQSTVPEAPRAKQQPSQPVGAATAERVPTAGGAAAKPAGAAIAPAKQHQTRSLLIKIGAIAAGAAAIGTVFALSRGTSSKPPGAP